MLQQKVTKVVTLCFQINNQRSNIHILFLVVLTLL